MYWCNPSVKTHDCSGPNCFAPNKASECYEAYTNSDLTEGQDYKKRDLKTAALAKLTDEEKAALGLS